MFRVGNLLRSARQNGRAFDFAAEAHKKGYRLSNQEKPKAFSGEAVVAKGSLDKDGKANHVESTEAAMKWKFFCFPPEARRGFSLNRRLASTFQIDGASRRQPLQAASRVPE